MTDTSGNPVAVGAISVLGRVTQDNEFGTYDTCGQRQQVCKYNKGFGALIVDGSTSSDLSYPQTPEGRWTSADVPIAYGTFCSGSAFVNARCYTFDPSNCPNLGGNAAGNKFFNAGPNVECYYNASIFTNPQAVIDYGTEFGKDETYTTKVAPILCARQATACSAVSGLTTCSNMFAADDTIRGICDEWRRIAPPTFVDAVSSAYCIDNDTGDCNCFNRQSNNDYQLAKGIGLSFAPDACWYVPCTSPTVQLIPLIVSAGVPACANIQVCSTITQIIAGGNVNYNPNLQGIINCDFSNPTNPSSPTNPPVTPPTTPPGLSGDIILYLALAFGVLLIFFLALYFIL